MTNNPTLLMLLHWAVAGLMLMAFITTVAVRRSPFRRATPIENAGSNITAAGWLIAGSGAVVLMLIYQQMPIPVIAVLSAALLAFGQIAKNSAAMFGNPCHECPFYKHAQEAPHKVIALPTRRRVNCTRKSDVLCTLDELHHHRARRHELGEPSVPVQ